MNYEFQSILQDVIIGLIKEKRELGYKYETEERQLKQLDKLAFQTNLEVITITREFAEEFIKIRPNEKQINSMNRVGTIRILAEYMNRKG